MSDAKKPPSKNKSSSSKKISSHLKYPRYRKESPGHGGGGHGSSSSTKMGSSSSASLKTTPSMLMDQFRAANDPSHQPSLVRPTPPKIVEFLNIEDYSTQTRCDVAIDEPLFQPYPSEVTFSQFEAFGTYSQKLYFRNNDAFARRIKLLPPDTPYFTVSPVFDDPNLANPKDGKVASGMEVCYIVTFLPREKRDYEYSLVCVTEREKFILPIRASGTRACLDFPDSLSLGVSPVKHEATHTFLVRNIGEKPTKFTLSATEPFGVYPRHGYAGPDSSVQISVLFTPPEAREYTGELTLEYESGQVAYVQLDGQAQNVNVHLSSQILDLDPAYISLTSQKTVKIYNRSDIPVRFSWKAFGTPAEESAERNRLHQEINRMEAMERQNLELQVFDDEEEEGGISASASSSMISLGPEYDDDGDSSDDGGENGGMPLNKRRELAALSRKYKHLRRAVEEDELHFADESFRIEPSSGEVWANSEFEFTIMFSPETANDYACLGFLEVVGRETRLPLKMQATGIGPQAAFSYDVLDIGDVFVNSEHIYTLTLENHGDIVADYELRPSETPFGPKFTFTPEAGSLAVGDSHEIEVKFCSEILGEFSEHFHFHLRGTSQPLSSHFKGHVVGPTFHFDVDELNFGVVSYEFLNNKVISLFNTSEIPMTFKLRVPQDGKFLDKEFDITPESGTIEPDGRIEISVDFISTHVRKYEMYLTVDVESVGEGLLSIPISGECRLPEVSLELEEINYGACFLRYPYTKEIVLKNESDQRARFEIQPQTEHSTLIGTFATDIGRKGTIEAHGKISIPMTLTCEKLGKINLPMMVRISGSEKPALTCALCAQCVGPNLVLSPTVEEGINWGPTTCLKDTERELKLTNDSLIPAPFRCYFKNPKSVFRVDINSGMLAPQESITLTLTAHLDDTITHKEQLNILVHEGASISFPLVAKGIGTTLFCQEDVANIQFGYQFTAAQCERRYLIQNRGRRVQSLQWINQTKIESDERLHREWVAKEKERKLAGNKKDDNGETKKKGKKGKSKPIPAPEPMLARFTVEPEEVELKPGTACWFSIYGKSPAECDTFKELLICESKLQKEKNFKKALECNAEATFIRPQLELSSPSLQYVYTWEEGVPLTPFVETLKMKNITELPLEFGLKTTLPFSIDQFEFVLQPGESTSVNVTFNPGYRDDRISHIAEATLIFTYRNHPQKDIVPLTGEIHFPNLLFDYTTVDFGTVLNDTTKTVSVRATNTSSIDANVQWVFESPPAEENASPSKKKKGKFGVKKRTKVAKLPAIPINQVFDILPIRSLLRPGESEIVEFAFYAHANREFSTTAVAVVQGGPEYPIKLQADASTIIHRIDCKFLDFGKVPYHSKDEVKEFNLLNPGQVPYDFRIRMDQLSRPDVILVNPSSGRIYAGDKQKISITFRPGIPDRIMEQLMIDIAHFEPVVFPVYGHGIFTSCHISLPRSDKNDESWLTALDEAKRSREGSAEDDAKFLPPEESRPNTSQTNVSVMTTGRGREKAKQAAAKLATEAAGKLKPPGTAPAAIGGARKEEVSNVETVKAGPDELANVTEANRIVFMRHILSKMEEHADIAAAAAAKDIENELNLDVGDAPPAPTAVPKLDLGLANMPSPVALQSTRAIEIAEKGSLTVRSALTPDFILATYVCDFGNVIAGTTKKRKFSLTNTGFLPVSFTLDTAGAAANGFSVDPPTVKNLPEQESMTFKIVMQSRRNRLGRLRIEIPIFLQDGPCSLLVLTANVCIPDISIQPKGQFSKNGEVDFEKVICGRQKVKYIQLKNLAPVPTTWSRVKPATGSKGKDDSFFVLEPNQGVLPPKSACNVAIRFNPTAERTFNARVSIKCQSNPKLRTVDVCGNGTALKLRFDPPSLRHDPVLPFDDPNKQLVEVVNDTQHDIEFYSLDFDQGYIDEENILRAVTQPGLWQSSGRYQTMLVPPREPGQGLPDTVLEANKRRIRKETRRKKRDEREEALSAWRARKNAAEEAGEEFEEEQPTVYEDENLASTDEEGVGEIVETDTMKTKREEGLALDICIMGPTLSGHTDQADLICQYYGTTCVSFDDVIEEAMNKPTQAGILARDRCGLKPLGGEEVDEDAEETGGPTALPLRLLVSILRERIGRTDCSEGIVLKGLQSSKYAKDIVALSNALKVAFGPSPPIVEEIPASTEETEEKEANIEEEKLLDMFAALDDDELDNALSPSLLVQQEASQAKGGDPEAFAAAVAKRVADEKEVFDLAMSLPVGSGMMRVLRMNFAAGEDGYVEHITSMETKLANEVARLEKDLEDAKKLLSDEETAQLEADFEGDMFFEKTEDEVSSMTENEKEDYEKQRRVAGVVSLMENLDTNKTLLNQLQATFHVEKLEEEGDGEAEEGEGKDLTPAIIAKYTEFTNASDALSGVLNPSVVEEEEEANDAEEAEETEDTTDEKAETKMDAPLEVEPPTGRLDQGDAADSSSKEDPDVVLIVDLVAGKATDVTFKEIVSGVLPAPLEKDEGLPIPDDELYMILNQPSKRRTRIPIDNFSIVTMGKPQKMPDPELEEDSQELTEEGKSAPSENSEDPAPSAQSEEEFEVLDEDAVATLGEDEKVQYQERLDLHIKMQKATRWIIPANSRLPMSVDFVSTKTGEFSNVLEFEVVGSDKLFTLPCQAKCDVPHMNTDTRNIFMRRAKGRPPQEKVHKKFVLSRNSYEFGPLRVNKPKETLEKMIVDVEAEEEKREAAEAEYQAAVEAAEEAGEEAPEQKEAEPYFNLGAFCAAMDNADVLQISNNGMFETTVNLAFRDHDSENAEPDDPYPFVIYPKKIELDPGETKVVSIWAFPQSAKTHSDTIVCSIRNNPRVYEIPLSCMGVLPTVDLHGPWEEKTAPVEPAEGEEETSEEPEDKGPIIDFDRLLLKNRESREFSVKNTCAIPVAWRLKLSDQLRDRSEFDVGPTEGILQPNGSAYVTVNFEALEAMKFQENITIEFSDIEGGLTPLPVEGEDPPEDTGRVQVLSVTVNAEAYNINYVVPQFGSERPALLMKKGTKGSDNDALKDTTVEGDRNGEEEDDYEHRNGEMDFGALRVFESAEKTFTLNNSGDYDIRFSFVIRRKATAKLFTVEPMEGLLVAGEEGTEIKVTFLSSSEVSLRNNKDIRCEIYEPKTDELFESFDLTVGVRSTFSTFRLQPLRGINFGAVKYGQTMERTVEIRNDGEFEFAYNVVDIIQEAEKIATENAEAKEAGDEALTELKNKRINDKKLWDANLMDKEGIDPEATVEMGAFTMTGAAGLVAPGATATMTLQFNAEGSELFRAPIRIDVSGRSSANATGKSFEIVGESVIPGIETRSFESIFEEQAVVANLQPVGVGSDDFEDTVRTSMFAEQQGTFSFGAVVPSQAGKLGVAERFKITNPNKIKALVNFDIIMSGLDVEKTAENGAAYQVQPSSLELPPHEHRYVTVYFKPVEMRTYNARFSAKVQDGTDITTNQLSFELTGEGTLPCVTVENPVELHNDGSLLAQFPRTRVGKSTTAPIVLRNGGTVPVSVYFSMESHPVFSMEGKGRTITLRPKASERLHVTFNPTSKSEDGEPWTGELKVNTAQNEYGTTRITLRGESYADDIAFENLPGGKSDEIDFGELPIVTGGITSKVISFSLENQCDAPVRYTLPELDDFTFAPANGHIVARGKVDIVASFRPAVFKSGKGVDATTEGDEDGETKDPVAAWTEAVEHKQTELDVIMQRIIYPYMLVEKKTDEEVALMEDEDKKAYFDSLVPPPAWNTNMKSINFEEKDDGTKEKIEVTEPEPAFENDGEANVVKLKVTARADRVKYTCEQPNVTFRPTMMFQTRVFRFNVVNDGAVTFNYDWALENQKPTKRLLTVDSPKRSGTVTPNNQPVDPECPFEILPESGSVPPGETCSFTVRFSPLEVPLARDATYRYKAHAHLENLAVGTKPLSIDIIAPAQRPICHFAVEDTDYLERRPTDLPGPSGNLGMLDPTIKVMFFESLGTSIKNTQRFKVINPTNMAYEFQWEPIGVVHPAFNCSITSGLVLPGKRHEMIFEYTPSSNDIHGYQESFWRFTIPAQNIDQLFLVAGTVLDPRVQLDHTFVNFGQVLLGNEQKEIVNLVNREHIPFGFSFDKTALRGDGGKQQLVIEPMHGTIPADGKFPLTIRFAPSTEKTQNVNVTCNIRRKPHNLSLNLKGEGAGVHDTLTLIDASDESGEGGKNEGVTLSTEGLNFIDFGHVHINDIARKKIVIHNSGKFNTDFTFSRPTNPQVKIVPRTGTVKIGERYSCELTFHPITETPISNLNLSVTVAGTNTYDMSVSGVGAKPMLDFSFIQYDFGPCFVPERGAAPMQEHAVLRITNNEFDKDVSFDCLFQKLPFLEVKAEPTVLKPNQAVDVPIIFTPRDVQKYSEQIPFELNGLYTVNVTVEGEGCLLKVDLLNPAQALVSFGSLRVGQESSRRVRLVNRSKRSAVISLSDIVEAGSGRLEDRQVTVFPRGPLDIPARGHTDVEIQFHPQKRIEPFNEEVRMSVAGSERKLLNVTGSCQAIEIHLGADALPFGTVCEGCSVTRKLQIENSGDLGASFKWDNTAFLPNFSVSPTDGFLAPHASVVVDVKFHPTRVFDDFRCDRLMCMVEGAQPLFLTLSGVCVAQPSENVNDLQFSARVREVQTKSVTVSNPSASPWHLQPTITNEFWSGAPFLDIPAKGSATYELVYCPLSMTAKSKSEEGDAPEGGNEEATVTTTAASGPQRPTEHRGQCFFALPDGTGILYNLFGDATEPEMAGSLEQQGPAKQRMTFILPVKNWLKKAQRFKVTWTDDTVRFTGSPLIDVPALGSRDYKLSFTGFKDGEEAQTTVTFENQETGEFIFYDVSAACTAPIVMRTIKLKTAVRQPTQYLLTIENPLGKEGVVTFPEDWWKCDDPAVKVKRLSDMMGATEGTYEVEYRPLVPTGANGDSKEAQLVITSVELGDYIFKLDLSARPAASERALHFKAALGASHVQTFRFRNYVQGGPTTYTCKVGNPDSFEMNESVTVEASPDWNGTDGEITINFEPLSLGEVRDTLRISSSEGGEFVCMLYGHGIAPLPQGPFLIPDGTSHTVEFKNVFNDAQDFVFVCDNSAFAVTPSSQKVDANKSVSLSIKYTAPATTATVDDGGEEKTDGGLPSNTVVSKLFASCPSMKALPPWVYYLKGTGK
jgi:hydrocephalus-inducing protein